MNLLTVDELCELFGSMFSALTVNVPQAGWVMQGLKHGNTQEQENARSVLMSWCWATCRVLGAREETADEVTNRFRDAMEGGGQNGG